MFVLQQITIQDGNKPFMSRRVNKLFIDKKEMVNYSRKVRRIARKRYAPNVDVLIAFTDYTGTILI